MAELAQGEGCKYSDVHRAAVTDLDLEWEFGFISKRLLKVDLYSHAAYLFEPFHASQKRQLLDILSRMTREYERRKRRSIAWGLVEALPIEEVLDNRARGTYRVEEDTGVSP
jgi:hypothetical protein